MRTTILTFLILLAIAINACSQKEERPKNSIVEQQITFKELALGENIKNVAYFKKLTEEDYLIKMEYFGSTRYVTAKTDENGKIWQYETTLDGEFSFLKSSLEKKLTAENKRPVEFYCTTSDQKPDDSMEISEQSCIVSGKTELLNIKEVKFTPLGKRAEKYNAPRSIISISLKDTELESKTKTQKDNKAKEEKQIDDEKRKNDL